MQIENPESSLTPPTPVSPLREAQSPEALASISSGSSDNASGKVTQPYFFFCIYSMILYISTNNLLDRHRHANQPYGFWQRDFSNWNYSEHLYFILIVSVESVVDSRILSLQNEIVIPAKTDDMQNTVRRRFIDARLIEFYAKIVPYVLRHWHWGFGFICVILPRVNFNNLQHAKRNNAKWMKDKIIFGHIFV